MKDHTSPRQQWRTRDELARTAAFEQAMYDEFSEEVEAEPLDGTTRRHFLGVMGASLAMTSLSGCIRRPEERILPYAQAPEDVLPGVPQYYATATAIGGYAIGLVAEAHEGRPTKLEGNAEHPGSRGATSGMHQALVLELYDPARLKTPRKGKAPADWAAVADFIERHFRALRDQSGAGVAVLSEATASPTLADLRDRFGATFPAARWYTYEPISDDNQRAGLMAAFGEPVRPSYRLDDADVVLSLDADFLATDGDTVANARGWAEMRQIERADGRLGRLYVAEGAYSLTGSNADHRIRMAPSRIQSLAFALVGEIKALGGAFPADIETAVAGQTADLDEKTRAWAKIVAADLVERSGGRKAVVIAGRNQPPAVHAVTAAINHSLGAHGATLNYFPDRRRPADDRGDFAGLGALTADLNAGKVNTLIVLGGNPVYTAPGDVDFATAMQKAKTTICLSEHPDETSKLATWAIPRAHFLEAWGDVAYTDGRVSVQQPVIAPLHGAWSDIELLARVLLLERTDGYGLVRQLWKERFIKTTGGAAGYHKAWRRWLFSGVIDERMVWYGAFPSYRAPRGAGTLLAAGRLTPPAKDALEVVFTPDPHLYDGRFANNSWLLESPNPMTKVTWDNVVVFSPATAAALDVADEDRIRLTVNGRAIDAVAWTVPGTADNVAQVTLGWGRDFDNFLPYHDRGVVGFDVNPLRSLAHPFLAPGGEVTKGSGTYPVACVQRFARQEPGYEYEKRQLVRETTLAGYKENPRFAKPGIIKHGESPPPALVIHPPEASIFGEHDYTKGYQWGMTIDLNTCTGCNACLVACVAENNISMVGKDQVRRGREMHWIRLDRYFVGDADEPEVVHQPIGCQHCETAPCENVCPVTATSHSPEGLNDMAYNRCIGTRYCANNCPFKVRRFNFYNFSKGQNELVHMQRNPNVTVRFRGVIEKCTYCVQRINWGKRRAKMANDEHKAREIINGLQSACAQACPSGSIVFGNINDPESAVSRIKKRDRDYTMLSELNLKPRTSFLAKVRNPNPKLVG